MDSVSYDQRLGTILFKKKHYLSFNKFKEIEGLYENMSSGIELK